MKFVEIIEKNINKTINCIAAKNKKLTFLNRIRLSLRKEYETLNDAYVKLGKYYYENLRDSGNEDNKELCNVIDECVTNIGKLKDEYYSTMSTEYSDPIDDELDVEIFEIANDGDESAFIKEIENVIEEGTVKPIDGEAADDDTEETSDEPAIDENEESTDEAAPDEDEEASDEAEPDEDEEASDEAEPDEDEETSDEAEPDEDEETSDEAEPDEDEETSDEAEPDEDEETSDEAAPDEDEETSDEPEPDDDEETSDEAEPDEDEETSDKAENDEDEETLEEAVPEENEENSDEAANDEEDSECEDDIENINEEAEEASTDENYEDDTENSEDEIVAGIKDLCNSDDFVINKSFENLGDNVSVLEIKKDDEDRNIHIPSDSPEDIIAIAYSQVGGKKTTDLNNDSLEDVINNIFGSDIVVDEIVDSETSEEIGYTDDLEDDAQNNDEPYIASDSFENQSYYASPAEGNDTVSEEYIQDNVPESIDSVKHTKEDLQTILENYFGPDDDYRFNPSSQNYRSFSNWNKISDSLADDVNYICNNDNELKD